MRCEIKMIECRYPNSLEATILRQLIKSSICVDEVFAVVLGLSFFASTWYTLN